MASPQDRKGPLPPEEALKTFRAAPGHRVELVAAEPAVVDPVAMAFDEDGRLYVAEMRDYPQGPPAGTIRLLEDADGDGRMEKSTVFAEGLAYPTSVLPWKGGILAAAAYEVLYLRDTDGDGKADERKTVFAGFGRQNSQHVVNGLQYGLDNWVYGAAGLSGGKVGDVSIQGSDFRFRPAGGAFEPVPGNSQFGNAFDEWGRRFIVRHDNHILHPVLSHRYLKRSPHLTIAAVADSISDHGNIPRLHPVSPRDSVFTTDTDSSCAITIHRGSAFVCEPVLNLVHQDALVPKGASFTARRAIEGAEFLASTDPWCRPVNLSSGPDGALYVADMYRAVIEHPDYIPKEIQKKLDLEAGKGFGRIYRVLGGPPGPRPRLGRAAPAELVRHLEHEIPWWRLTAQRLLVERQAKEVAGEVKLLLRDPSKPALARLHALWTLEGLDALDESDVAEALKDSAPGIREHALRLAEPRLAKSQTLREAALGRADDPDARVRFQAALTLGEVSGARITASLSEIGVRDSEDPWTRAAVLTSAAGAPADFVACLFERSDGSLRKPGVIEIIRQLAGVVGARRDAELSKRWLHFAVIGDRPERWQKAALHALAVLRRAEPRADWLEAAGVSAKAAAWSAAALGAASDTAGPTADRAEAIDLLTLLAPPEGAAAVENLLSPKEAAEVQAAAVRALAAWPGDPAAGRLLDGWAARTVAVRREILAAMLSRPVRVRNLLDRIEKGDVRAVELEPHHRTELLRHPDGALRARARTLLQAQVSADREEVIREVTAKLAKVKGDRVRGEKVFVTSCATCHRLRGQGTKVGPDLEAAIGRDRKALLADLLDPNRAMDPSYQVYLVRTASNETFNGVVASETPASVTLRRAAGEETTILRKDIAELKAYPFSMMAEGIESSLTAQDFADLLEFLSPAR